MYHANYRNSDEEQKFGCCEQQQLSAMNKSVGLSRRGRGCSVPDPATRAALINIYIPSTLSRGDVARSHANSNARAQEAFSSPVATNVEGVAYCSWNFAELFFSSLALKHEKGGNYIYIYMLGLGYRLMNFSDDWVIRARTTTEWNLRA